MSGAGGQKGGGDVGELDVIGYQPEYSAFEGCRLQLRTIIETLKFEALVIFLVTCYAIIIFIDLTAGAGTGVDLDACINFEPAGEINSNATMARLCQLVEERDWLYYTDLIFLSIFVAEIVVRIYAFGATFFRDTIQVIDMVVVILAFVLALIPDDVLTSVTFLNVLRVVRLFRLAVIINKLQRSREAAVMRRKRAMYRRMGAPVEKVLTFLTSLRGRLPNSRDHDNIDWMMEIIAGEELYSVADFDEDQLLTMQARAAGINHSKDGESDAKRRNESFSEEDDDEKIKRLQKANPSTASLSLWVGAAIASPALSNRLQRLLSQETAWGFDIFEFDKICAELPEPGKGLSAALMCYYTLEQHGVLDALEIERSKMLAWLEAVDKGYQAQNAYHNNLHAADVCANLDYFLRQPNFSRLLSPIDYLAALVAAVIHDLGHPGLNNTFLEATKHDLAITYNDVSVLENHHVSEAFKLLKTRDCDWTRSLSSDQFKDMRETVIQMVLGTDMRAHFEYLTKFKSKMAGDGFNLPQGQVLERKDMRMLLTMALHAADIANPAKREIIATTWAKRSMIEFFRQGDKEAELGLPTSPFMDRNKTPLSATIVNCQIGFINVLVRPLLAEWTAFLGDAAERDILLTLDATLRLWETQGAKVIESWGSFAQPLPPTLPSKGDSKKGGAPAAPSNREVKQRM